MVRIRIRSLFLTVMIRLLFRLSTFGFIFLKYESRVEYKIVRGIKLARLDHSRNCFPLGSIVDRLGFFIFHDNFFMRFFRYTVRLELFCRLITDHHHPLVKKQKCVRKLSTVVEVYEYFYSFLFN